MMRAGSSPSTRCSSPAVVITGWADASAAACSASCQAGDAWTFGWIAAPGVDRVHVAAAPPAAAGAGAGVGAGTGACGVVAAATGDVGSSVGAAAALLTSQLLTSLHHRPQGLRGVGAGEWRQASGGRRTAAGRRAAQLGVEWRRALSCRACRTCEEPPTRCALVHSTLSAAELKRDLRPRGSTISPPAQLSPACSLPLAPLAPAPASKMQALTTSTFAGKSLAVQRTRCEARWGRAAGPRALPIDAPHTAQPVAAAPGSGTAPQRAA